MEGQRVSGALRRSLRSVRLSLAKRLQKRADQNSENAEDDEHSQLEGDAARAVNLQGVLSAAVAVADLEQMWSNTKSQCPKDASVDEAVDCINFESMTFAESDNDAIQVIQARSMPMSFLVASLARTFDPTTTVVIGDFWSRHSAAFKPKRNQAVLLVFKSWDDPGPLRDPRALRRLLRVPKNHQIDFVYGQQALVDALHQERTDDLCTAAETMRTAIWWRTGQLRTLTLARCERVWNLLRDAWKNAIESTLHDALEDAEADARQLSFSLRTAAARVMMKLEFFQEAEDLLAQSDEDAACLDDGVEKMLAQAKTASLRGSLFATRFQRPEAVDSHQKAIDMMKTLVEERDRLGSNENHGGSMLLQGQYRLVAALDARHVGETATYLTWATEADEILRSAEGPLAPICLDARLELIRAHFYMGKYENCLEDFETLRGDMKTVHGPNHLSLARLNIELAELHDVFARFEEAQILEGVFGEKHYRTAHYIADLGNVSNVESGPRSSLELNLEALAILEKWFPNSNHHPTIGVILFNVAHRLDKLGEIEEAYECMLRVKEIFANGYPKEHYNTQRCHEYLQTRTTGANASRRPYGTPGALARSITNSRCANCTRSHRDAAVRVAAGGERFARTLLLGRGELDELEANEKASGGGEAEPPLAGALPVPAKLASTAMAEPAAAEAAGMEMEMEMEPADAPRRASFGGSTAQVDALCELWEAVKDGTAALDAEGRETTASVDPEKRHAWTVNQVLAIAPYAKAIGGNRVSSSSRRSSNMDGAKSLTDAGGDGNTAADADAADAKPVYVLYAPRMPMEIFVNILERELPHRTVLAQALHPRLKNPKRSLEQTALLFSDFDDDGPLHEAEMLASLDCIAQNHFKLDLLYGPSSIEEALKGPIDPLLEAVGTLETIWHNRKPPPTPDDKTNDQKRAATLQRLRECWALHVEDAVESARQDETISQEAFESLLCNAGRLLTALDPRAFGFMAADYLQRAVEMARKRGNGEESLAFVEASTSYGAYYAAIFAGKDALAHYEAALPILRRLIDKGEVHTPELFPGLTLEAARAAARCGHLAEYERLARDAVDAFKAIEDPTFTGALAAQHELGRALFLMGHHEEALHELWSVQQELKASRADPMRLGYVHLDLANVGKLALEKARENLGPQDLSLWSPLLYLGEAQLKLFKFNVGMKLMEEAMEIIKLHANEQHVWYIDVQAHYARALGHMQVQRHHEARRAVDECLAKIQNAGISPQHPWFGAVTSLAGGIRRNLDEVEQGIAVLEMCFGKDHFRTTPYLLEVADMQNGDDKVETSLRIVRILHSSLPGKPHVYLGIALCSIGMRARNDGDYETAVDCFEEGQFIFEAVYPVGHPNRNSSQYFLMDSRRCLGSQG
ncbi:Hypothetical Protein FCC1311_105632 [Hondaea fermentalgiana]|uniref:Nephrocystin-3 n=1 Tax=Hondaea fermentalgiana TaxID=2315210 RepID=A0A2R5GU16_9STRA|nr:Hypothetical Protein FCC1311_105632 [Hondaea fermentalgiana]|eukprot:GBG34340.1 Hypothetical Protein FCC1311_105632 [Hondaea fermentalgiana]